MFYRHNTTEQQWYRPNRLPGIAYQFELKWGVSHTYANENVGQPWGFVERVYGGKRDRQTIKQLRRYFCVQYLFRAVYLKSTSLAMHSNVIRELQNNLSITKYKLSILLMHGNCTCMAPGDLEVAHHQLVWNLWSLYRGALCIRSSVIFGTWLFCGLCTEMVFVQRWSLEGGH